MKTSELMALMEKAGQKGGSELNMRSEDLQKKKRAPRIKMLKKDLKKKAKEMIVLEIALPFNPATGEEDDEFNPSHKFRPPVSATSAALIVKKFANDVLATKEKLMKRAGVTEWDTSDPDTFTEQDREVLKKYRVPRLFTINVVSVKIPAITKDRSRDYAIKVNRDENTGDVIGEWPVALKINKLFRDTEYEEVNDYRAKIDCGEINHTEDQQKKYISAIYQKNPVSDDHPANWVELIEIPLNKQFSISSDMPLDSVTADDIKEHRLVSRYSKGIREKVESFMGGDLVKFDKYFDYIEIDMSCPNEGDTSTAQGKMDLGKDTTFDKPTDRLFEQEGYDNFAEKTREMLDNDIDIEKSVLRSVFVSEYNADVEKQLIAALPSVYELDNEFCTEKVLLANKDIITTAFGSEGMELIEDADAGITDKDSGKLDEGESKTQAKEYDLSSDEYSDESLSIDEIDLQDA